MPSTLEETLAEIRKRLNGEPQHDIETLFEAADDYADEPYQADLNSEISRMLIDIASQGTPEEQKQISSFISQQSSIKFALALAQARKNLKNQNYPEALETLAKLEKQITQAISQAKEKEKGHVNVSFRYYFSPMEYALGDTYFPANSTILLPLDLIGFLSLKAQALYLSGRMDEALYSLSQAFEYDPVSSDLAFLACDIAHKEHNVITFVSDLDKAHRYLYKKEDFNKYFFYLSTYMIEEKDHSQLGNKIRTLAAQGAGTLEMQKALSIKDKAALTKLGYAYQPSAEVIAVALKETNLAQIAKDTQAYNYFHSILVDLVGKDALDETMPGNVKLV
jgi:tetratricopeptide (TPR) repeat protein